MIKSKWIGAVAALLMAAAVLITGFAYFYPSAFATVTGAAEPAYVAAMDKNEVLNIEIIADETKWANMLDNATEEEYIPATVLINGRKLENVAIRPKGNSSLSTVAQDSTTDRYSFKIEFDHYIDAQTWLGLDKIALNNMQGDASYMKEYISYDIMSYIGVESPLYTFANITVNGETWGFYLAVECLEEGYAQRVYGNDYGNLYKPESMGMRGNGQMNEMIENMQGDNNAQGNMQIPDGMQFDGGFPDMQVRENGGGNNGGNFERNFGFGGMASGGISLQYTDNEISNYSSIFDNSVFDATDTDYARVISALERLSNGEDLENTVDVEAVLKYFAAHTVVVNLDSYVSSMAHNYYLYEDDGQLTILPWDYNLSFGGFQSGNASSMVNFPIDTPVSGVSLEDRPLLGKLLEVPEYLELYHEYLREIVDGYFNSGLFEQTIDSLDRLISSYVENDPSAFYDYDAYKAAVSELKKLGLLRAESVEGQLNGTIPSTSEGQSADSSLLIDASGVNLSALGSMGGGGFDGGGNFGGGMGGNMAFDRDNMQKAMEIIQSAGENDLTEEQLTQLRELGITDEQIEQFRSFGQGGFGGMGRQQGEIGGQRPNNVQRNADNVTEQNPSMVSQQSVAATGFDINSLLFIGGCTLLILLGLLFVVRYKRRNA